MQTTFRLFFSCLFCLSLIILSGCGGGGIFAEPAPTLTPAEQAEIDPYITKYGKSAIAHYLSEARETFEEKMNRCETREEGDALLLEYNDNLLKYTKYLAFQGADVNAKSAKILYRPPYMTTHAEVTPLFFATTFRNVELVKFLVSKGADASAKLDGGITTLHVAVPAGNVEMVKILVSAGADVNSRVEGLTPLNLANDILDMVNNNPDFARDMGVPVVEIVETVEYLKSVSGKSGEEL